MSVPSTVGICPAWRMQSWPWPRSRTQLQYKRPLPTMTSRWARSCSYSQKPSRSCWTCTGPVGRGHWSLHEEFLQRHRPIVSKRIGSNFFLKFIHIRLLESKVLLENEIGAYFVKSNFSRQTLFAIIRGTNFIIIYFIMRHWNFFLSWIIFPIISLHTYR